MKLPTIQPTPMSCDEFICHLIDLGYKRLGSGSYATVYAIPDSNYVCKVGFVSDTIGEDGYLRFLSKMNQTNPLFPKVEAVGISIAPLLIWIATQSACAKLKNVIAA